jgi:DNA mismatch repair protein MutL
MSQEPCSANTGTSISIKNLFYNTPARRNFLKSNPVEMRHIIDEFQRVALANPQVFLTMHHDGQEVYHLPASALKQRIVHLFGNNYNQRLVPVEEETTIINLRGFVGKPEFARKTRGEQFFFVNNRFIKDAYLNHAVLTAFEELLPDDDLPAVCAFYRYRSGKDRYQRTSHQNRDKIPGREIYLRYYPLGGETSLGKYNITPTLDFDQENSIGHLITQNLLRKLCSQPLPLTRILTLCCREKIPNARYPFCAIAATTIRSAIPRNWDTLYEISKKEETLQHEIHEEKSIPVDEQEITKSSEKQFFQVHNRFILSQIKSGFMLINQQAAHERILYERFLQQLQNHSGVASKVYFRNRLH